MRDSRHHYVIGVTFQDDSVFLGTTASNKPVDAAKKIYGRVKSDLGRGKDMESKLQQHLAAHPELFNTADPFVYELHKDTVSANEKCNEVLDQLVEEGWNVLNVSRKNTDMAI